MTKIIHADITTLIVDAIINTKNNTPLGGGDVDGAIYCAAGSELLAFNRIFKGCKTGEANVSPDFQLPAK